MTGIIRSKGLKVGTKNVGLLAIINIYAPNGFAATTWLDRIKGLIGDNYIVVGDFNINFLKWHNNPKVYKMINLLNWLNRTDAILMNMDQVTRFNGGGYWIVT